MSRRRRVVIAGAAGRDFHNFNTVYRDDPGCEVVAFTATQIPGIAGRRYPAALAGPHYPEGIEILPEAELYAQFPHIGRVLPAVGYSAGQLDALRRTIESSGAEVVVAATPADLARLLGIGMPVVRVHYEFQDLDSPGLWGSVQHFLISKGLAR